MYRTTKNEEYLELTSPTSLPKASGFLWNEKMMIQVNCRGYAVAQFMQPEPSKYSYAPNLEAKTFMQPEQPYYAHHPGRFVYIKDEETGEIFSAPYEPTRAKLDQFTFAVGKHDIVWKVEYKDVLVEMTLTLPKDEPLELWKIKVKNLSNKKRNLSIYPYFSVGYMSWMNQSGEYNAELQGIVCSSITPYQKYQDYATIKELSDKTFFIADQEPTAWEVSQEAFEGEGGLAHPSAIQQETLSNGDSRYEMPAAVLQYRVELDASGEQDYRFVFGPAFDEAEVKSIREKYILGDGFDQAHKEYTQYIQEGKGVLTIKTPDAEFDNFVNHWLPRQMYYHGQTNRLTTDPQTRNFLQDHMGMSYINPDITRESFLFALGQQHASGAMPDGIILIEGGELKYINQVPHTDHCVWLPICLKVYLDETNDYAILDEIVPFAEGEKATVLEHMNRAMRWLIQDRDERGLNYINQGDWNDPMNMVGYKGKGVSGWLTIATVYAFKLWADICEVDNRLEVSQEFQAEAEKTTEIVQKHLWDGEWFARGITDDNVVFGISKDKEGRIFLNPQGWSFMGGIATEEQKSKMLKAVVDQLESPYGVEMLGPAYTAMREDVGRVTQKHPGSAENGSIYNHAAAFYIYSLYCADEPDNAYRLLRKMLPGTDQEDILQRGQLPVYIPNYYRGAYRTIPRTAGRSSHLFNTGTVSWYYRSLIDGLFGLQGHKEGLQVKPQLPSDWNEVSATRMFRGAEFQVDIQRDSNVQNVQVTVNGQLLEDNIIRDIQANSTYQVTVKVPS